MMDFHMRRIIAATGGSICSRLTRTRTRGGLGPATAASSALKPRCSKDNPNNNNDKDDRLTTNWDKAWSSFRKKGKKSPLSQINPNKYVSWNPRRSEYPISEELDPIKRTERSNLMLWTSPKFTLAGAIVVVTMLLIYTLLAPLK